LDLKLVRQNFYLTNQLRCCGKAIAEASNQEKEEEGLDGKMIERPINPYWVGGQFLRYCVKQGWLKQEGAGGRGTKWYPTDKGREALKEKFEIEL
jgi:hypothetical protein